MSEKKKSNLVVLVLCIIIYLILMVVQNRVQQMNMSFLNGLIAQVQNIVIVLMTVKAHKSGFIASVIINLISSIQTLLLGVIIGGSLGAIPGVVIPIVMILMSYLIYNYSDKMQKANEELSVTINELNKSNATLVAKDEKLMYLAYHDLLTGLANKQLLVETMDEKISKNADAPFTVLEVNVDNIKEITDKFGMNVADEIIFSYAERIKNACGDKYFIACLNSSRFIILVDGIQSQNDIMNIANIINNATNQPIVIKETAFKTTMSYGVASYPVSANNTERLIQCVNASVDYVISRGGNNIKFYVDSKSVYIGV